MRVDGIRLFSINQVNIIYNYSLNNLLYSICLIPLIN